MVEISKSGSGEGLGWATGPGYSTVFAGVCVIKIDPAKNGQTRLLRTTMASKQSAIERKRICFSLRFIDPNTNPGLGDMLCLEYYFKHIQRLLGPVEIFLVTDAKIATRHEAFLRNHSAVAGVIVCPPIGAIAPWAWLRFYRRMRRHRFSTAIVGGADNPFGWHAWLCGIAERVGLPFNRFEGYWLNKRVRLSFATQKYDLVDRAQAFAQALGVTGEPTGPATPRFAFHPRTLPGMAAPRPIVAVHPGCSPHWNRRWPTERYAALCARVCTELGGSIYVIGGDSEWPECESIRSHVETAAPGSIALNLAGRPLEETANYLSAADLYIGNDSGLLHLAAALGTRAIGLFGSTDPHMWRRAYERFSILTRGYDCQRDNPGARHHVTHCSIHRCPYRYDPAQPDYTRCLQDIPLEEVWSELRVSLGIAGQATTES